MAQKDAKINIELLEHSALIAKASKEDSAVMKQIAIETKKDNASMKTIAVLGMFFLPGTFVAVRYPAAPPPILLSLSVLYIAQITNCQTDHFHHASL